ncbi:MAG TPA: TonB-dependent receptor [Sphingomicrobium sp.]|nr:TonB-dependent receptor [Sphingomicrobium sp.]
MVYRPILLTGVAALAFTLSSQAPAQTTPGDAQPAAGTQATRITSYEVAYFAQFAPRSALDIARRVPGFNLDLGDNEVRGFAGAAGNVVINGARPSSKAESLETTLARIPAQRVTKVEVGPGDLYGADYSSKSQVLNIVLSAAGGVDGNVTGSVRRLYTGTLVPDGSASALIRTGPSSINLSAGFNNNENAEEGTDTLLLVPGDALLEHRRKYNTYSDFNPYVSGSWALERASDKALRVNARWSPGQFDLVQRNRVTPAAGAPRDDSLLQDYDNPVFELGGDITRPLAGGAVKLVGLATRRKRNNFDAYIQRNGLLSDGAVQVGGFEQTQKARRNETIGRLTWTRQGLAGFSVEAGAEAVLNTLDSRLNLVVVEPDGSRTPIDLPVANADVKEKRGEAFINVGRQLSPSLRLDTSLRAEYSHLTVTGDASADRKLRFWKPGATLDWKPGGGWHTQFSIKRTVAQLDFYDFVSVAELSTDRVNAGNQNLQPQRAWEFRATVDRPLFGDGLVKLDLGYDRVSMLQDRVLIFDEASGLFFDAPGNIGNGTHAFARLNVDAPLGGLWKGLRVKFNGTVRRTRVKDPISGEMRNFTGFFPDWQWNVEARRDSGAFSYGFSVSDRDRFTFFRTDELDTNYNGRPYGTLFVEYRPSARTSIAFDIDNALDTSGNRQRLRFIPNRAVPALTINEIRERNRHLNLGLTIKQTFGGGAK